MVGAGIQPKKLAVQHVRKPSDRMPVRHVETGERPSHISGSEPRSDMHIPGNVVIIIPAVQEFVMYDRKIQEQRHDNEYTSQQNPLLPRIVNACQESPPGTIHK